MIEVERMNGERVYINPDQVKAVESMPDTVVVFMNNDRLMVKTTPQEIVKRVIEFRRQIANQFSTT